MNAEIDELDDDAQDLTGLKRKVRELLGANRRLKDRVQELEQLPTQPEPEPTTPRERFLRDAAKRLAGLDGDARASELAKLEQEMAPLVDAEIAERHRQHEEKIARMNGTIRRVMRESAANDVAMRVRRPGVSLDVLVPLIRDRFDVEERDGEFITVVKGADGRPITAAALAAELRANPALAPVVAGASQAEQAAHSARVAETLGQSKGAAR